MRIESVHLRRFRGLESASLSQCSGMNVLIGRNNAGKSSVLNAIETGISHLSSGRISTILDTRNRPVDEFTNRNSDQPIQIGISFHFEQDINNELRQRILASGSGLEVAVNNLESANVASVICAIMLDEGEAVLYVQEMGLAPIDASAPALKIRKNLIFSAHQPVAKIFANRERSIARIRSDIASLERLDRQVIDYSLREAPAGTRSRMLRDINGRVSRSTALNARIEEILSKSETSDKAFSSISQLKVSLEADIEDVEKSHIDEGVTVFSGKVHSLPEYVSWLLKQLSAGNVLSFKEIRDAVGRDEANQILKLKTKRGGAEALARVQSTVKSLLGVQVDAFEPESTSHNRRTEAQAEMDVDDFLVEANGAGIREALRIILDLELKSPCLAFIEEPEVHLHPGLERVLHRYLVSKSENVQLFVATHSANFLDASARQNIYLVSRSEGRTSEVQKVASEGDLLKISEEVGLRPSTVLMFDRLVFVEGPSDEEVLTELSRKLGLDIHASSTIFVQMGGASRFAHYAAEATLDLLSRRKIKMWFVIDRDERGDSELTKLSERLGNRAELTFLGRREIENYLLFPDAIHSLLLEKISTSGHDHHPTLEEIGIAIDESAQSLLERAIDLRLSKTLLKPVYAKYGGSTLSERLTAMNSEISERIGKVAEAEGRIRSELTTGWEVNAKKLAPGSEILDAVFSRYGHRYKKEVDGRRLAERIDVRSLDTEISNFLKKVTA